MLHCIAQIYKIFHLYLNLFFVRDDLSLVVVNRGRRLTPSLVFNIFFLSQAEYGCMFRQCL